MSTFTFERYQVRWDPAGYWSVSRPLCQPELFTTWRRAIDRAIALAYPQSVSLALDQGERLSYPQ